MPHHHRQLTMNNNKNLRVSNSYRSTLTHHACKSSWTISTEAFHLEHLQKIEGEHRIDRHCVSELDIVGDDEKVRTTCCLCKVGEALY
jgi:hypothetical protein